MQRFQPSINEECAVFIFFLYLFIYHYIPLYKDVLVHYLLLDLQKQIQLHTHTHLHIHINSHIKVRKKGRRVKFNDQPPPQPAATPPLPTAITATTLKVCGFINGCQQQRYKKQSNNQAETILCLLLLDSGICSPNSIELPV